MEDRTEATQEEAQETQTEIQDTNESAEAQLQLAESKEPEEAKPNTAEPKEAEEVTRLMAEVEALKSKLAEVTTTTETLAAKTEAQREAHLNQLLEQANIQPQYREFAKGKLQELDPFSEEAKNAIHDFAQEHPAMLTKKESSNAMTDSVWSLFNVEKEKAPKLFKNERFQKHIAKVIGS